MMFCTPRATEGSGERDGDTGNPRGGERRTPWETLGWTRPIYQGTAPEGPGYIRGDRIMTAGICIDMLVHQTLASEEPLNSSLASLNLDTNDRQPITCWMYPDVELLRINTNMYRTYSYQIVCRNLVSCSTEPR